MAKFKKTKFDFRNVVLFPRGRYFLLAGNYKEQHDVMKLAMNIATDMKLGEPYLQLIISDSAFRYMALEIKPDVGSLELSNGYIVIYDDGVCEGDKSDD